MSKIKPPSGIEKVFAVSGTTQDIINCILFADSQSKDYTKEFSEQFNGLSTFEICKKIWDILKTKITYKEDGLGRQDIKSPGALWASKIGDCKSFSVFTASILKNLGIEHVYRFTGYQGQSDFRHVYIIANPTSNPIIIDGVWHSFNAQKPYKFKKDIMPKISYIGQIPDSDIRIDLGNFDPLNMTEGQLDLILAADAARDNYKIAERLGDGKSKDAFAATHDALIATLETTKPPGMGSCGIGYLGNPTEIDLEEFAAISGLGSWLKKAVKNVGKAIKKGAKAVAKVATAPFRLAVKGIMEILIPRAAPWFAYSYLPDAALSAKGRRKKRKASKIRRFVTKTIGMKESHFRKIVNRGLHKRLGVGLNQMLERRSVSGVVGVGAVPIAAAAAVVKPSIIKKIAAAGPDILGALGELLKKIFSVFGKGEQVDASDVPEEEDFVAITQTSDFGGGDFGGGGASGSWGEVEQQAPKTANSKGLLVLGGLALGGYLLTRKK